MIISQRDRCTGVKVIEESYLFYIPQKLKKKLKKQAVEDNVSLKYLIITYCKIGLALEEVR